ncbi:MAG: S8 family serine peptidase [Steroidobacteraceae bacterium]
MIRLLLLAILLLGPAAEAQIGVPRVPLPGLPIGVPGGLPAALGLPAGVQPALTTNELGRLEGARKALIAQLLRRHADMLEADPNGNPIVRGEVLALSPTDVALARGLGAGFTVLRERSFGALGIRVVVLGAPHGMATSRALTVLRRLDPAGTYDFNSVYTQSGATSSGRGAPPPAAGGLASAKATSLGLIDGGVATAEPVFQGGVIHQHGCGGALIASAHGTEVASLMVGRTEHFGGAAPGVPLYTADVYCGKPTGGAVDAIAGALEWLAGERVPVINVSLVGPPNALLQQAVARVVAQGFLIVAAVGNDGPAAPPLYPAAYPGVVGVTAVDARRRVIFEAERGPQVMFAAPGADIRAAALSADFQSVRGTSFAAPLVAGLLAEQLEIMVAGRDPGPLPGIDPAAAHAAVDALARAAIHLGAAGRNTVFGYGLVGANLPSPGPASKE